MTFTATHILVLILMFSVFFLLLGVTVGLFIASKFDFALKVGARNQFEFYAKEMNERMKEVEKEGYNKNDMFPPNLDKDYGVPRELK